jgi:undecaprenyl-diphosphatase
MKRTLFNAAGLAALFALIAVSYAAPVRCAAGAQGDSAPADSTAPGATAPAWADSVSPRAASADSTSLDARTFRLLNRSIANPVFDAVMPVVTDFSKWRIVLILVWCALVMFGRAKGRWTALMLIPIIAASDQLSSHLIKPIFERVRPCDALGGVHLWYGPEGWITTAREVARSYKASYSFPSSHAANITASMLFLGLVYRRWIVPLLAVAALVSLSRIYIGVHWPSDVAAGMALGAFIAWLAYAIFRRAYRSATQSEPDTRPSE